MLSRRTKLLTCVLFSLLSTACGSTEDNGAAAGSGGGTGLDGGTLESGDGTVGDSTTAADVIEEATCAPRSCAQVDAECGSVPDGCGATIECGTCAGGKTCGGGGQNKCGDTPCSPKTCAQLGASCGQLSDGCTSVLDCGWCTAPDSCGGGGKENQCGCTCTPEHGTGACSGSGCTIVSCEAGWADCNASAEDGCEKAVAGDPSDCGACGNACALSHATSKCVDGTCQVNACDADWGDCDLAADNGCEANLLTSKLNCGDCGLECPGFCTDGLCECTKPCGEECCTTGQKCCLEAQMCWASGSQCPAPR